MSVSARVLVAWAWLIGALLVTMAAPAATLDRDAERAHFRSAMRALEQGDLQRFDALLAGLADYPLHDYLQMRGLRRRLEDGEAIDTPVREYLSRNPGPLAARLRRVWLTQLAERGEWRRVLVAGRSDDPDALRCLWFRARFELGELTRLEPETRRFWMRGGPLPEACGEVFAALLQQSPPSARMVWERIELAMEKGNVALAVELSRWLSEADKGWADLWVRAHRDPAGALESPRLDADVLLSRRILRHALDRFARDDAAAARDVWQARRGRYIFSPEQRAELDRHIALRSAYQRRPEAHAWLSELPAAQRDRRVNAWRARSALYTGNWSGLLRALDAMAPRQREDHAWRYWRARALERLGRPAEAVYAGLAERTSYYGFLAADRLARPYRFNHEPARFDASLPGQLEARAEVVRAREFLRVDLPVEARREWQALLATLDETQKLAAAALADSWGWHDRAVYTMARTSHRRDFALRFPMPFSALVESASDAFALEPALIYGVLRRESAYREDARSRAGALGLMQLMPSTARGVARALGTPVRRGDLLRAEVNIRFGSKYLRDMLDRFAGHEVLATAAYNAGPHRVQRWLPEKRVAADLWVDTLPFRETRRYVRAVMAYTTIFDWRTDRVAASLRRRMRDIEPPPGPAAAGALDGGPG